MTEHSSKLMSKQNKIFFDLYLVMIVCLMHNDNAHNNVIYCDFLRLKNGIFQMKTHIFLF